MENKMEVEAVNELLLSDLLQGKFNGFKFSVVTYVDGKLICIDSKDPTMFRLVIEFKTNDDLVDSFITKLFTIINSDVYKQRKKGMVGFGPLKIRFDKRFHKFTFKVTDVAEKHMLREYRKEIKNGGLFFSISNLDNVRESLETFKET